MTRDERMAAIPVIDELLSLLDAQTDAVTAMMDDFHKEMFTAYDRAVIMTDSECYKQSVFRFREALLWMAEAAKELRLRKEYYAVMAEEDDEDDEDEVGH